jgi:hypothetical protein
MTPWLRYLIAFIVGVHGFIYVRIGPVAAVTVKGWRGSSWLLGGAVTNGRLKTLVVALHIVAGIATLACAVAIMFTSSAPGWWRPLAIGGATIGIAAFAVFWDGQTQLLVEEGAIGVVVSMILLMTAMAFPLAFG